MLPNIRVLVGEVYLSVSDHPTSYICRCKCNAHEDTKNNNIHCYRWHDAGFPARAEFHGCSYYYWKKTKPSCDLRKMCVCVYVANIELIMIFAILLSWRFCLLAPYTRRALRNEKEKNTITQWNMWPASERVVFYFSFQQGLLLQNCDWSLSFFLLFDG